MNLGDANLIPLRLLGQGSFGRVFLCKSFQNKNLLDLCVKRMIIANPKRDMRLILEEVYIFSQLKHPNIVQFIRSFVHAGTINIVMEYASQGTMRNIINLSKVNGISLRVLSQYFIEIIMGLEYLHIRNVIHRDLKPENLLVDNNNHLKISDFGISIIYSANKQYKNPVGTPFYMAPEILRGEKFDYKTDIWALGCILFEMATGFGPFYNAKSVDHLYHLIQIKTHPKLNCNIVALKCGNFWALLCELMLTYDRRKRISLPDIFCMDSNFTITFYDKYFDYD